MGALCFYGKDKSYWLQLHVHHLQHAALYLPTSESGLKNNTGQKPLPRRFPQRALTE